MKNQLKTAAAAVVASMFLSAPSEGAGYLKIGDIKGESQADGHKEWIEILSFSQSVTKPGGGNSARSRRRGDVVLEDISVVKEIDKATPLLLDSMCSGKHFDVAEIHFTRTDPTTGAEETYLRYELTDVLISSYLVTHSSGDAAAETVPVESMSLNYGAVTVLYAAPDPDCPPGRVCPPIWVESTCVR
jgi:type VI secretion system secreted protein Hcp